MLRPALDAQRRFESGRRAGITTCVNIVAGVLIAYVGTALTLVAFASFEEHIRNGHNAILGVWLGNAIAILIVALLFLSGVSGTMAILARGASRQEIQSELRIGIALDVGSVWFLWIGPVLWSVYIVAVSLISMTSPLLLSTALLVMPFIPSVILPILWSRAAMRGLNALAP